MKSIYEVTFDWSDGTATVDLIAATSGGAAMDEILRRADCSAEGWSVKRLCRVNEILCLEAGDLK